MTDTIDILITNGTVLTMDDKMTMIENGAVAIASDRIQSVGKAAAYAGIKTGKTIDAKGGIIMPGLVNTHTHAAMTLFRGLADDLPLMDWLHNHIFPAEAKLDYTMVHTGARLACAEMIRSGTTCFCDMYLFEDAVAMAAASAGMRSVVGEVLYDFPSPNYGPIEKGFEYTRMLMDKWQGHPLVNIAVEPHSPYLCAPELLETAAQLAKDNNALMVIHLSETGNEVEQVKKEYGQTPVGHLAKLDALFPGLLACHCVVLSDDDKALLKKHDVKVSHNPESNMKLASGVAPICDLLDMHVCTGLGTDGCSSNNNLDMFAEMDTAAKLHKVFNHDPTVMDAARVLKMATIDGAKALGLDAITGSIGVGKRADIIIVDTQSPHLVPMYNPISHLVYSVRGSDVTTSVINGTVVMEDRRLLTIDMEKTMEDVHELARQIKGN